MPGPLVGSRDRPPWAGPARAAGAVASGAVAILASTGLWLATRYPPGPSPEDEHYGALKGAASGGRWIHELHVVAAGVVILTAAGWVVSLVVRRVERRRLASSGLLLVVLGIAVLSGQRLRWTDWLVDEPATNIPREERDFTNMPDAGIWDLAFDDRVDEVSFLRRSLYSEPQPARDAEAHPRFAARAVGHLLGAPAVGLAVLALAIAGTGARTRWRSPSAAASAGALAATVAWLALLPWDLAPVGPGALAPRSRDGTGLALPVMAIALAIVVLGVLIARRGHQAQAGAWTLGGLASWAVLLCARVVSAQLEDLHHDFVVPIALFLIPALYLGPLVVRRAERRHVPGAGVEPA